ncbi:MAG: antibiotic biosynthesis monooxygenase [Bacteroidetes bacterium]|nr:antibiotic biosynthesis monooxygenase [Bacteroidota bacterium]
MITRIVKMTFKPDSVEDFQALFDKHKQEIAQQPGCKKLSLLRDINNPTVFMTYSWWESQEDLNNYRHSDTFGIVWPVTKALFSEKPDAWSVEELVMVK